MGFGITAAPGGRWKFTYPVPSNAKGEGQITFSQEQVEGIFPYLCQHLGRDNTSVSAIGKVLIDDGESFTPQEQKVRALVRHLKHKHDVWPKFGLLINRWLQIEGENPDDMRLRSRAGGFFMSCVDSGALGRTDEDRFYVPGDDDS